MMTTAVRAVRADDTDDLLAAWRRPYSRAIGVDEIDRLRALLAGSAASNRPVWSAALDDAPAAVGLGVRCLAADVVFGLAADLVFSLVLTHSVAGDRAASLVVGRARARRHAIASENGRYGL